MTREVFAPPNLARGFEPRVTLTCGGRHRYRCGSSLATMRGRNEAGLPVHGPPDQAQRVTVDLRTFAVEPARVRLRDDAAKDGYSEELVEHEAAEGKHSFVCLRCGRQHMIPTELLERAYYAALRAGELDVRTNQLHLVNRDI